MILNKHPLHGQSINLFMGLIVVSMGKFSGPFMLYICRSRIRVSILEPYIVKFSQNIVKIVTIP